VDFSNENYTALEGPTLPPPHALLDNGPLSYSGVDTITHNAPNNTGQKDALSRHSYSQGLAFQQKELLPQNLGSLIPSQTTENDKRMCGVQSTLAISDHSQNFTRFNDSPNLRDNTINIYTTFQESILLSLQGFLLLFYF
jgi:hypothetical protein